MTSKGIVYCGPSVKNVVRQYTVFEGGVTPMLNEFLDAHPIAKAFLVPVDDFAGFRVRVETRGTRENTLLRMLQNDL